NEIDKLADTGSIRICISGGDVLKREYIDILVKKENVFVYNTYGPTEATVCAAYYRCMPGDGESLPIGKPITNYNIYIVDRYERVLPMGVPGEMWIAGPGAARGYLNNPELTAKKFFAHELHELNELKQINKSFSGGAGGRLFKKAPRLYKTGDLGRWLPDGNIEFMGRIDHQVKLRGFRIEPGEIENRLLKYEGVKAALVRVKGEGMLCVYIAADKELTVKELKEYLLRYLPDYMVPSHYVILERLPLTPHGKPDLKVLETYKPQTGAGMEYTAPGTDVEIALSGIWKELLNLDKVSIHDNFFDVGGNSMLLLKAANKIKEELKVDIPYVAMFQYTTIHALGGYLNSGVGMAATVNPGSDKYEAQSETLEKGKDRMKKFINKSKGVGNG
ncbi:MAG: hypothetical protein QG657_4950, partial [Acidobacteriota bacterium]|nr:hypothetical protein [Acidobacteriota bacterium]